MPLSAEYLEDDDNLDAPSAKNKRPAVHDDIDEEEELGSVSDEEDDEDDDDEDGDSVESEEKVC